MLETGALAPHFVLLGKDGREYALPGGLEGEPALLVFFKTTCGTCDTAFPYLVRLRDTYPEGWRLWSIAQDPPDKARDYAEKHGLNFPVLIDAPKYDVSRAYDPEATPTLFLVDRDGRTVYETHGFAKEDMNEIARRIAEWTGSDPVEIAPEDDGAPAFKPG